MKEKIKKIAIIVMLIALGFVAVIGIRRMRSRPAEVEKEEEPGIPVMSQTLAEDDLHRVYRYSGTVEYENRTRISPRLAGVIDEFLVAEGERIKAGEKLVKLDDEELRNRKRGVLASLEKAELQLMMAEYTLNKRESDRREAEAGLREARSNYEKWQSDLERDRRLYQDNAISRAELEQTENQYAAAEANQTKAKAVVENTKTAVSIAGIEIQQAESKLEKSRSELAEIRTQLSYTELEAPFAGEVIDKIFEPGEYINPGEPVLEVASTDNLKVTSELGMSDFADIDAGTEVEVDFPGMGEETLNGKIINLKALTDPRQRTTEVTISLPEDKPEKLREGMYASVSFYPEIRRDVISVPRNSLFRFEEAPHVYVIEDERAERRQVETGLDTGHEVEILSGLEAGEKIAISNIEELRDGADIYLRDEDGWGS